MVEPLHDRIKSVGGGRHDHPRRGIRFPFRQLDLAGKQQLPGIRHGAVLAAAAHREFGVAAPGRLQTQYGACVEAESRSARVEDRAIESGLPAAELAYPVAVLDPVPLRIALIHVASREVEDLAAFRVDRHTDVETFQHVDSGLRVADGVAHAQGTARHPFDLRVELQSRVMIGRVYDQTAAVRFGRIVKREPRRPSCSGLDSRMAGGFTVLNPVSDEPGAGEQAT